jgi:hypothetical protein
MKLIAIPLEIENTFDYGLDCCPELKPKVNVLRNTS